MSATLFLSSANVPVLVSALLNGGKRVLGPTLIPGPRKRAQVRALRDAGELALDAPLPVLSIKQAFFPATEILVRWRQRKQDVELQPGVTTATATVLFGVRPCDAASPEILDRVMGWDYRDQPYFARREATTVVGLACAGGDASCFCTAVGLGPDATRGSDLLLTPVEGGYAAQVVTPKGQALVDAQASLFAPARASDAEQTAAFVARARQTVAGASGVDSARVREWLGGAFQHPFWATLALRCHGCGACAFVCPTCHCFDIVDEPESVDAGVRRRNWDTCQTGRFTVHGSGHNPRADQNARFRQRVMHKFSIYPARFGEILCTGCGRCARACPAGMDLPEILSEIGKLAGSATGTGTIGKTA